MHWVVEVLRWNSMFNHFVSRAPPESLRASCLGMRPLHPSTPRPTPRVCIAWVHTKYRTGASLPHHPVDEHSTQLGIIPEGAPPCRTSRKPTSHSWQTLAGTPVKQFPLPPCTSGKSRKLATGGQLRFLLGRLRKAVGERVHTQGGTSSALLPAPAHPDTTSDCQLGH